MWLRAQALEYDQQTSPLKTSKDCAEALRDHLGSQAWEQEATGAIKKFVIHYVEEGEIKRGYHYYEINNSGSISLVNLNRILSRFKNARCTYDVWDIGNEKVGVRRFTCGCYRCSNSSNLVPDACDDFSKVAMCKAPDVAPLNHLCFTCGELSERKPRRQRDNESISRAKSLLTKPNMFFACRTPAYGYSDAYELFQTVLPAGQESPFVKLGPDAETISGIRFDAGCEIIHCRVLPRDDADPDRCTFLYDETGPLRAVEARTVAMAGIDVVVTGSSNDNAAVALTEFQAPSGSEVYKRGSGKWCVKPTGAARIIGRFSTKEQAVAAWQEWNWKNSTAPATARHVCIKDTEHAMIVDLC